MTDWLQGEAEIVLGRNVIEPKLSLILRSDPKVV